MSDRISIFLLGPGAGASLPQSERGVRFQAGPETRPANVSSEYLNRAADADAAYVAFAPSFGAGTAEFWESCLSALESQPEVVAALVPFNRTSALFRTWRRFPTRLALLMGAPEEQAAVVIRRSALTRAQRFEEVEAPIWDWLIRAVAEQSIAIAEADLPVAADAPASDDLPALTPDYPGADREWLHAHLERVRPEECLPNVVSQPDVTALKAGLLGWHDYLDESHTLAQSVQGQGRHPNGDYWHAIMHRREPDYANSKYWFRRVGPHPVFEELAGRAAEILDRCDSPAVSKWRGLLGVPESWDPYPFVDMCEHCATAGDPALTRAACEIQREEMLLLLFQTWEDAGG